MTPGLSVLSRWTHWLTRMVCYLLVNRNRLGRFGWCTVRTQNTHSLVSS